MRVSKNLDSTYTLGKEMPQVDIPATYQCVCTKLYDKEISYDIIEKWKQSESPQVHGCLIWSGI